MTCYPFARVLFSIPVLFLCSGRGLGVVNFENCGNVVRSPKLPKHSQFSQTSYTYIYNKPPAFSIIIEKCNMSSNCKMMIDS